VLTTFCYGTNMGPAQAAGHIRSITAHELSVTARRHVTVEKLNKAIADVVYAFTELDLIKARADGSVVITPHVWAERTTAAF
jgi:Tn3 transposase DDE domain